MEHISSRQNAVVKHLRGLASARAAHEVLLDGPHLVEEALTSGIEVTLVAVSSGAAEGPLGALAQRAVAAGARGVTLPPSLATAVSPVRHPSGIVAVARLATRPLHEVLQQRQSLVLLLDTVQDPGNVGAIVRAAEACGATGVVTSPGTADPFGWKALRGSMGSAFRVPIASAASLHDAVVAAREAGLHVFATVPRGGTALTTADLTRPSAIVLGGEGSGLSSGILDAASEPLTIPMRPPVESLNVAIAAALVLYEALRQRHDVPVR